MVDLKQKLAGVSVKGILAVGGGFTALGALIYLGIKTGNKEAVGAIIFNRQHGLRLLLRLRGHEGRERVEWTGLVF